MLALPPFRGLTRQLILTAGVLHLATLAMSLFARGVVEMLVNFLVLHPAKLIHGLLWEVFLYPLFSTDTLGLAFALLSIWFFASSLEDDFGSSWLGNYLLVATVGGGLLASALTLVLDRFVEGFNPDLPILGLWPAALALLLAYARFHPDQELNFNFILKVKAKHLAAIYLFVYLAFALAGGNRIGALAALCNAIAGYVFLIATGRHGLRYAASERWFGLRNAYARAQRRRSAKRFQVYMRKQGRDVRFDAEGRLINEETPKDDGRPRWMN